MRTWKRLLLLCLTLALLTSALPAMAAEAELTYELRSSGVWITGPQDYSGDLVLPEEIEGSPVVGVAARAFSDNTGITSVTLPESLRYIEEAAFYNCRSLREPVLIPDDMEWIWPDAFYGNAISGKKYSAAERYDRLSRNQRFIQTGILPNCRTVWQDGMAFWIRDGEAELVSLPSEAEYTLYLPEEVAGAPLTSIGAFSFMAREYNRNHTRIKHVVLPISIKTVEPYAFYSTQLDSIFLHEGVQELKDYSLCTDYSNTVITLPASLERLGDHVFSRYYSAYYPLTVYAYGDSPAAQRAAYESAKLVDRIGSNGKRYGCYGGWYYTVENGQAELTRRMSYASNFIPDEIEGAVIRELDFDRISYGHSFKTIRIPPTVTNILDKEGRMRDTLFLVYPGSYAESFCKEKGYAYESAYTEMGVPFTDTPENRWYYEAVCYAYNTGLMSGVSDTRFAPEDTTSRAMLVTVLWRLAGCPEAAAETGFADVVPGSWYEKAVNWAAEQGIVQGVSASRFAPNDPVTREQIATILLRYAKMSGLDDGRRSNVAGFPDAGSISPWALEGIRWAKAAGILTGQLSGTEVYLNPLAGARRSEIAAMLMRFCVQ